MKFTYFMSYSEKSKFKIDMPVSNVSALRWPTILKGEDANYISFGIVELQNKLRLLIKEFLLRLNVNQQ